MALIFVTGISGSGKSSVRKELGRRGFTVYGTDEDDIAAFYHNATGTKIGHAEASLRTEEWRAHHSWKMPRELIEKIASEAVDKLVFLCGVTSNDDEVWDLFDQAIALVVDDETLEDRLANRTNNDYGKSEHERRDVLRWQKSAADDYRKLGATLIDSTRPIETVVDDILAAAKR